MVDGNYAVARDIVWPRADAVVWLDLPFHIVIARLIKREFVRCVTGRELWNGTTTSFRHAFLSRDSVIWWAATTWGDKRQTYTEMWDEPTWSHLDMFRVRSADLNTIEVRRGTHEHATIR